MLSLKGCFIQQFKRLGNTLGSKDLEDWCIVRCCAFILPTVRQIVYLWIGKRILHKESWVAMYIITNVQKTDSTIESDVLERVGSFT